MSRVLYEIRTRWRTMLESSSYWPAARGDLITRDTTQNEHKTVATCVLWSIYCNSKDRVFLVVSHQTCCSYVLVMDSSVGESGDESAYWHSLQTNPNDAIIILPTRILPSCLKDTSFVKCMARFKPIGYEEASGRCCLLLGNLSFPFNPVQLGDLMCCISIPPSYIHTAHLQLDGNTLQNFVTN